MTARLWRHQAVLVLVAGALFVLAWALLGATVEKSEPIRWLGDGTPTYIFDTTGLRRLTWAVAAAGLATAGVLAISVVHVTRVLTMLFRGEPSGNLD